MTLRGIFKERLVIAFDGFAEEVENMKGLQYIDTFSLEKLLSLFQKSIKCHSEGINTEIITFYSLKSNKVSLSWAIYTATLAFKGLKSHKVLNQQ